MTKSYSNPIQIFCILLATFCTWFWCISPLLASPEESKRAEEGLRFAILTGDLGLIKKAKDNLEHLSHHSSHQNDHEKETAEVKVLLQVASQLTKFISDLRHCGMEGLIPSVLKQKGEELSRCRFSSTQPLPPEFDRIARYYQQELRNPVSESERKEKMTELAQSTADSVSKHLRQARNQIEKDLNNEKVREKLSEQALTDLEIFLEANNRATIRSREKRKRLLEDLRSHPVKNIHDYLSGDIERRLPEYPKQSTDARNRENEPLLPLRLDKVKELRAEAARKLLSHPLIVINSNLRFEVKERLSGREGQLSDAELLEELSPAAIQKAIGQYRSEVENQILQWKALNEKIKNGEKNPEELIQAVLRRHPEFLSDTVQQHPELLSYLCSVKQKMDRGLEREKEEKSKYDELVDESGKLLVAATFISLIAAPYTGGASLAVLLPNFAFGAAMTERSWRGHDQKIEAEEAAHFLKEVGGSVTEEELELLASKARSNLFWLVFDGTFTAVDAAGLLYMAKMARNGALLKKLAAIEEAQEMSSSNRLIFQKQLNDIEKMRDAFRARQDLQYEIDFGKAEMKKGWEALLRENKADARRKLGWRKLPPEVIEKRNALSASRKLEPAPSVDHELEVQARKIFDSNQGKRLTIPERLKDAGKLGIKIKGPLVSRFIEMHAVAANYTTIEEGRVIVDFTDLKRIKDLGASRLTEKQISILENRLSLTPEAVKRLREKRGFDEDFVKDFIKLHNFSTDDINNLIEKTGFSFREIDLLLKAGLIGS